MTSVNPSDALRRGHLLRDFAIPGDGLLSDFRGRWSLLFAFGASSQLTRLMDVIAAHGDELREANVRPLVVRRGGGEQRAGFKVVSDDGSVLAALIRQNSDQDPGWVVCVTDRFGEIFFAAVGSHGDPIPTLDQLLDWSDFAARTYEECFPPEWPVL